MKKKAKIIVSVLLFFMMIFLLLAPTSIYGLLMNGGVVLLIFAVVMHTDGDLPEDSLHQANYSSVMEVPYDTSKQSPYKIESISVSYNEGEDK